MNTENKGSYRAHEITRNTDTIKNTNVRKLTSIALMTIMVAGGLTFAIPGMEPAEAAQISSNPNLKVSAEGQNGDNEIAPTNIVQVIVSDGDINASDDSAPIVIVDDNSTHLTMRFFSGAWYGYFASTTILDTGLIDRTDADLDASPQVTEANADAADRLAIDALVGGEPDRLAPAPLGVDDPDAADATNLVMLYDLDGEFDIVYEKPANFQTVSMELDDPDSGASLDRSNYPQNTGVVVTIDHQSLNVDPTSEDSWFFVSGEDPRYLSAEDAGNVEKISDAETDRDKKKADARSDETDAKNNADADMKALVKAANDAADDRRAAAEKIRDDLRAPEGDIIDDVLATDDEKNTAREIYGDKRITIDADTADDQLIAWKGNAQVAYELVAGNKHLTTDHDNDPDTPEIANVANSLYKGTAQVRSELITGNPHTEIAVSRRRA